MASVRISREAAERGHLPPVCALTGESTDDQKSKRLQWTPVWVYFTGPLFWIFYLTMRKSMTVELPLSRAKHGHWLVRNLILVGLFVLAFGAIIAGAAMSDSGGGGEDAVVGISWTVGLLMFLSFLIVALVFQFTTIRPSEITEDYIVLAGVHEKFRDAVEEEGLGETRRRRRSRNNDDDDDYDRPRSRNRDRDRDRDPRDDDRPRRRRDDDYDRDDDRPRQRRYDD